MSRPHPIAVAAEAFIAQGRACGWADCTMTHHRTFLRQAVTFLRQRGCRQVSDVQSEDLVALLSAWAEAGRARSSRVGLAILLRGWFQWLQQAGKVVIDPACNLPTPDDGESHLPPPPLTQAEVAALFAALPRATAFDLRSAALVELLYGCGLRISEALDVDVDDLDLASQTILIRHGKGGRSRMLPLMPTAIAALRDWLVVRRDLLRGPDRGACFITHRGERLGIGMVRVCLRRLNAERGPQARHLHPHLLRHSIAVHLLQGGADVRYIQEFLGHAELNTTKIYLRLVPGRLKEDYDEAMPDIAVGLDVTGG